MTSTVIPEGVDINARNEEGVTALFVACFAQNLPIVQTLISRGADVNATSEEGWTPLMAASMKGNYPIAKALLDAGADPQATNDVAGCSALMYAAQVGCMDLVKELAPCSVVNLQSKDGWTAVMLAAQNNFIEVVTFLVKEFTADLNLADSRGYTALHFATQEELLPMVDLLLRSGANPLLADTNDVTPLHWAAYLKNLDLARMLVEAGANVNAINAAGATPFKIAKLSGDEPMVTYLLSKNARDEE